MNILCRFFCEHVFPFLLGEYQGVELLGHRVILYLTIGTAGLPEKEAILRVQDRKQSGPSGQGLCCVQRVAGDWDFFFLSFISASSGTKGTFHG